MRRRGFLHSSSMIGAAAFATSTLTTSPSSLTSVNAAVQSDGQPALDLNEVQIHPFQSDLMQGFPPPPDKTVTTTSHIESREHRVWAHQHMSELCSTQPISRGTTAVTPLPRRHRDLNQLKVSGVDGSKVKLIDLLRDSFTDAFLVIHNGQVLTEQYFSGMRPETRHHLWSASKSISMGVLFNLLAQGVIKEESLVKQYISELSGSGYEGATIRHLMDMQSGVQYDYQETDPIKSKLALHLTVKEGGRHFRASGYFPKLPGEHAIDGQCNFLQTLEPSSDRQHGSIFSYKCCDTAVLAWACEKVTQMRFADLVSQYVWSHLGVERDAYVVCDMRGSCSANAGMSMTLRDLARWGQMHVDHGKCNGRQVIPESSIRDIQEHHDPSKFKPSDDHWPHTAYRSQYWIPGIQPEAFVAAGAFGQYCYIHPQRRIVIARYASEELGADQPNWSKIALKAMAEVVDHLSV